MIDNGDLKCNSPLRVGDAHLLELRASGLTDDTIREARLYTENSATEAAKILNRGSLRDGTGGPFLVIPFLRRDGWPSSYSRVKPLCPGKDGRTGKTVKYESPVNAPNRLYIPPRSREAIADPTVHLLMTEGEKKALCATQHGFPCMGLVGVYGWQVCRKKSQDAKAANRELIPDLAAIKWQGRPVTIVFDSDAATNIMVAWAEYHLAESLEMQGAKVLIARLPSEPEGSKNGLDDFIVRHGVERFREVIGEAKPPTKPGQSGNQKRIVLGTDEFRVNDEASAALGADPDIFSRANQLVRVLNDKEQIQHKVTCPVGSQIVPLSAATLRERLTIHLDWVKKVEGEEDSIFVPMAPPQPTVQAILDRGIWSEVKPLTAVVQCPVLLLDGKILGACPESCVRWAGWLLPSPRT